MSCSTSCCLAYYSSTSISVSHSWNFMKLEHFPQITQSFSRGEEKILKIALILEDLTSGVTGITGMCNYVFANFLFSQFSVRFHNEKLLSSQSSWRVAQKLYTHLGVNQCLKKLPQTRNFILFGLLFRPSIVTKFPLFPLAPPLSKDLTASPWRKSRI